MTRNDAAILAHIEGRKPRSNGKTLERLVVASAGPLTLVVLEKIPNGVKFIGDGKTVRTASPVDFMGTFQGGRAIVFDAKECSLKGRFDCSADKLKPHQRNSIIRHGSRGAIAGLLVLETRTGDVHWLDWPALEAGQSSYLWLDMPVVGNAAGRLSWAKVWASAARIAVTTGGVV